MLLQNTYYDDRKIMSNTFYHTLTFSLKLETQKLPEIPSKYFYLKNSLLTKEEISRIGTKETKRIHYIGSTALPYQPVSQKVNFVRHFN